MIDPPLQQLAAGDKPMRLHLIGVAGSGMSGLAGLLLQLGHRVSGSDRVSSEEIRRLQSLGLEFTSPHTAASVAGTDAVIFSSAIRPGNVAYDAAVAAAIPLVRRAAALAAVMRRRQGIVVAGTHGKTTTTALAAHVLRQAGLRPGHYVGAEIPLLGTNAHWDDGEHFVAEGDESDGTLVEFRPEHAIILNIEEEHLDHYRDFAAIADVFRTLVRQTSGRVVWCADDAGAGVVCGGEVRAVSYGCSESADFTATAMVLTNGGSNFHVLHGTDRLGPFELAIPGRHNILNATAVIALATTLGVDNDTLRQALSQFRGARRRFETRYHSLRYHLVDDYGHHPTEIAATLAAARSLGPRRVLCLFQPHRYTRTLKLRTRFGPAFRDVDHVWVGEVYPASEPPIPGVGGGLVADEVNAAGPMPRATFVPELLAARLAVGNAIRPGDLVVSLGAGNVHECAVPLARDLQLADALIDASGEDELVVRLYEPMAKHTTLRVGGPAQFWVEPATFEGAARLVRHCRAHGLPLRVVGRGSNLLVRDGGIPGVVLHCARGEFDALRVEAGTIHAGAGVRLKAVAGAARSALLGGFEWMEGIPGTVGGAVRMNAGAMGAETFDRIRSVLVVNAAGELEERPRSAIAAGYRGVSAIADDYALAATFVSPGGPCAPEAIDEATEASRRKRKASQPLAPSAGCVFKNPAGIAAGRLIDELGLKGTHSNGAEVSPVHANFIVNTGGARARDVLALIGRIRRAALDQRGIHLELEVEITGEDELLF